MIESKRTNLIIISLLLIGVTANIALMTQSHLRVPYVNTVYNDSSKFTTSLPTGIVISDKTTPKVHDLPLNISLLQTLKLRMYLKQFEASNNLPSVADAYYRENSVTTSSAGVSVLIDIPSMQQTLSVKIEPDDTLSISCGRAVDQKEESWKCSDDSLGESE